jgi:hypothetical protein
MRFMENQRLFRIKVGSPDDFAPFQCLVRAVSNSHTIAEPMKPVAPITKTRTLISRRRPRPVEEIGCLLSFMPGQCRHRQHCCQCKHLDTLIDHRSLWQLLGEQPARGSGNRLIEIVTRLCASSLIEGSGDGSWSSSARSRFLRPDNSSRYRLSSTHRRPQALSGGSVTLPGYPLLIS